MSPSDMDELDAFAREIRSWEQPTPRARLRSEIRASLLAAPFAPTRTRTTFGARLFALRPLVALVVVFAVLIGAGGSAAASSLPGDPAFGLKRAVEDVQVALAPDAVARLDLLVTQADRRLADLDTVASAHPNAIGIATDEYVAAAGRVDAEVATILAQPASSARDAALARAAASSAAHIAALQALAARLPAQAQSGIQRAIEVQQGVHGKSGTEPGRPTPSGSPTVPGRPSQAPVVPPGKGPPSTGTPRR